MSGPSVSTQDKDLAKFALAIQALYNGRSNASGTCTLAAGATSTVVSAANCSAQSAVFLFPKTANAAAALATTYVPAGGNKTFTITHANAATVDRTFFYVCIG